jgi:hypothetical protein
MNSLRAMAGPKEFLLIADAKLISYGNVTALIKAGTDFIAPAPASRIDDAVYAALDLDAATSWTTPRPATRTPPPERDRPTGSWKTPTCRPGPARAIPRLRRAGSWCTPPATPKASSEPGTNAWPRPARTGVLGSRPASGRARGAYPGWPKPLHHPPGAGPYSHSPRRCLNMGLDGSGTNRGDPGPTSRPDERTVPGGMPDRSAAVEEQTVVDELYGLRPDQFTAARTQYATRPTEWRPRARGPDAPFGSRCCTGSRRHSRAGTVVASSGGGGTPAFLLGAHARPPTLCWPARSWTTNGTTARARRSPAPPSSAPAPENRR